MRRRESSLSVVALLAVLAFSITIRAGTKAASNGGGDFFIISSVDLTRQQLLLKFPTEVTEVMRVDPSTRYFDESGKPIKLAGLRAGDTVYVTSTTGAQGLTAVRIQKGPMTVDELHRSYLQAGGK